MGLKVYVRLCGALHVLRVSSVRGVRRKDTLASCLVFIETLMP